MNKIQQATKTLDYCVHSVMADLKETTTKNYQIYLKWGFDAWRELNLYTLPQIKTVYLTMNANKTIDIPEDCISYSAIGIVIGGQLWLLTRNDSMALNRTEDCPVPIQSINPTNLPLYLPYSYFFSASFRNGQYVGEQYARGGGWNAKGYYRIDYEKKQIQFSSVVPNAEIVFEYKSTGIDCDGTVEVPNQCITPIVQYIHWQRVENDQEVKQTKVHSANVERKRKLWEKAFANCKHYTLAFNMREYHDSKLRTVKSVAQR